MDSRKSCADSCFKFVLKSEIVSLVQISHSGLLHKPNKHSKYNHAKEAVSSFFIFLGFNLDEVIYPQDCDGSLGGKLHAEKCQNPSQPSLRATSPRA